MHISLSQIKEHLKETGRKESRLKTLVLEMIYNSSRHLSVPEILSKLEKQGEKANKTSVYRIIDLLMAEDVLFEVDLMDGKKRYAIKQGPEHPHLVCCQCGKVICLRSVDIVSDVQERIRDRYQFEMQNLGIQFFGVCNQCQSIKS
jgi:Fe2+ or Zn2+ uptake regulation protein